jgi:hypothetical protein
MSETIEVTVDEKKSVKSKLSDWYYRNQNTIVAVSTTLSGVVIASAAAIGCIALENTINSNKVETMTDFLKENNLLDKYHDYLVEDLTE